MLEAADVVNTRDFGVFCRRVERLCLPDIRLEWKRDSRKGAVRCVRLSEAQDREP